MASVNETFPEKLIRQLEDAEKKIRELKLEILVLRNYGNKDCTAQADEVLEKLMKETPDEL